MNSFIEQNGGRDFLEGLTTEDVCEKIIKPQTTASFCTKLEQENSDDIGVAEVFISHAWKYNFVDVCEALTHHFEHKLDTIIWFDVFCSNQHEIPDRTFDWWSTTFRSAIEAIGSTVIVFAPWHNPKPLLRAWCLWEVYCTVDTNCTFEIALSRQEKEVFFDDIRNDAHTAMKRMLASINLEKSECKVDSDRTSIFQAVRNSVGGFHKLNSVVFDRLRKWVIDTTMSEIATKELPCQKIL